MTVRAMPTPINWRKKRDWTNIAHLLEVAEALGLREDECLARTALKRPYASGTTNPIELWQELALVRNLVGLGAPLGAGLQVGQRYHLTTLGLLGYAMLASGNLLEAIRVCGQFRELSLSICPVSLHKEEDGVLLALDASVLPQDARWLIVERGLAAWNGIFGELLQRRFAPLRVDVTLTDENAKAVYAAHFPCDIRWGAERNGLLITWRDLYAPLPQANPATQQTCSSLCRQLCDELSDTATPLARRVLELLMGRSGQLYSARDVARWLGLSERTLHRRLAQEGQSFRLLDEGVRQKLAQGLLRDTDLGLECIAQQLGYSEAASFSRAFKRWTGSAPSSWRRRSLAPLEVAPAAAAKSPAGELYAS
jgi:AraC-like DNA-binding protein